MIVELPLPTSQFRLLTWELVEQRGVGRAPVSRVPSDLLAPPRVLSVVPRAVPTRAGAVSRPGITARRGRLAAAVAVAAPVALVVVDDALHSLLVGQWYRARRGMGCRPRVAVAVEQ